MRTLACAGDLFLISGFGLACHGPASQIFSNTGIVFLALTWMIGGIVVHIWRFTEVRVAGHLTQSSLILPCHGAVSFTTRPVDTNAILQSTSGNLRYSIQYLCQSVYYRSRLIMQ